MAIGKNKTEDTAELLRKYYLLPKRYRGRELEIVFENEANYSGVYAELADALSLEVGASIEGVAKLEDNEGHSVYADVYAEGDIAEEVLAIPEGTRVRARAITLFGIFKTVEWGEDGPITRLEERTGLLLKTITKVEHP